MKTISRRETNPQVGDVYEYTSFAGYKTIHTVAAVTKDEIINEKGYAMSGHGDWVRVSRPVPKPEPAEIKFSKIVRYADQTVNGVNIFSYQDRLDEENINYFDITDPKELNRDNLVETIAVLTALLKEMEE